MRNLNKLMLFVMMGSLLTLSSCSSSDDGGSAGTAGSGTITAKVDGTTVTSIDIASQATFTANGGGVLILQGTDSSGKGFVLTINGYNGTGTYDISDSNVFISAIYIEANATNPSATQSWSAPYANSGVIGEIKVAEETDDNVKGTFSFTGKNANDDTTKVITEGSFNLSKQTL
ncbi:DUF6252 family protein [uncultured Algibacter sp.]|uniref:DUF6252 family protein n=1 Tax=uncultured Algibacter sp. TaxID=298659 RepID=UPI002608674C|nr:DUF6252 family protein [uncultured Algibacter sp.]